ncbi:MAG TPA: B-box zinc finger protein [Chloroflexaceae bacterium]|nr:B-box zinc finger protein [Chloroflexaceae bacterium]
MEEPTSETTTSQHDVRALVAEGNAALIAGDSYTARQRFRQALELDPERVEAWVGLAGSVRPYREKREHLTRALAIDPTNPEARAVLAQVEARLAAGEVLAPGGVQVREPQPAPAEEPPPPEDGEPAAAPTDTQVCYIHPDRETGLHCTNCGRPICGECATRAAVGQLCPECLRVRRPVNYQVSGTNLLIAGVVALLYGVVVSFVAAQLLGMIGFFGLFVAFLLGPVAGDMLVRLSDRLTHNKKGRPMQLAVAGCFVLGALPLTMLIALLGSLPLALILFTIMAATTAAARLR